MGVRPFLLTAVCVLLSALCLLASNRGAEAGPTASARVSGQTVPGTSCPAFPADNVWNTPVTGLPVDAHSAQWLAHMDAGSAFLHPDFGPSGGFPYGIPVQVTARHPALTRLRFAYASESDPGPTRLRRVPRSKAGPTPGVIATR